MTASNSHGSAPHYRAACMCVLPARWFLHSGVDIETVITAANTSGSFLRRLRAWCGLHEETPVHAVRT